MSPPNIRIDVSSRPRISDNPSGSMDARDTSLDTPTSGASSRRHSDGDLASTTSVSHRPPASSGQAEIGSIPLENETAHKGQKFEAPSDLPEPVIPLGTLSPAHPSTSSDVDISSLSINQPSLGTSLSAHSRRVSDVSSVSVDDNHSEPYDVRDETAPLAPFFSSGFQNALKEGFKIAKSSTAAIEKLERFPHPGGHGERLLADGKQLSAFRCSDSRTIAFLGDSGEGKSSLINSLLHFPDIAATGDLGAACTSVVTEYRQRAVDQNGPIMIEVDYLSPNEVENLIKELVWNYRKPFIAETEKEKKETSAAEYARRQRESDEAWSALEAAFKHQEQFKKELLSDMSDGGLDRVTDQLILWAKDIEWPNGGSSGRWTSTAQNADECYEKTSTFMRDKFWPFTKIIRIYLDALVLKTGLVLADLPGLQDTNLARVQVTQRYLLNCDNIFLVTNIARAITDSSVKSSLYDVISRHVPLEWELSAGKRLKLAVVCTKSESINETTALREFCGSGKKISTSVMKCLDDDIKRAKTSRNRALKKELKRRKTTRRELLLIDARNCHVKRGLQSAYASKVPGGNLEVFCVSNTIYEKFSKKASNDVVYNMVMGSGIPELRQFCHSVTAEARLLEAKHFLQFSLSSLLNSIDAWINTALVPKEGDDDANAHSIGFDTEAIKKVERNFHEDIHQTSEDFDDSLNEIMLQVFWESPLTLTMDHRNEHWERAAEEEGQEWTIWHWTQYKAWCLNNGCHQTRKRSFTDWNRELIWKMRTELEYQWDLLEETIPTTFQELLDSVKKLFHDLESLLKTQGFPSMVINNIACRIHDFEYRFSLIQRIFARRVQLIRIMASETNHTSYILREMIPAYRVACRVQQGPGTSKRLVSEVQGRITDGTLFPNILFAISSGIREAAEESFSRVRETAEDNFEGIMDDIDMAATQYYSDRDLSNNEAADQARRDREEEEKLKADIAGDIQALKMEHQRLLDDISLL